MFWTFWDVRGLQGDKLDSIGLNEIWKYVGSLTSE
jgi:hypothetical protein